MTAKTLITYYSWSGTTVKMAKLLQQVTNGELLELNVNEGTFSSDMYETSGIATKQLETGNLPKLANKLPDLTQYEIILVGVPVWSSQISTPVQTFLQQVKDVTAMVIPFYTSTGSIGGYENDFKNMLQGLNVQKGIGMTAGQLQQVDQAIGELQDWWSKLTK
ncbi:flavodoxin [Paucilactobacillus hokkaidonensis JCM 18461]|uniref:Flavodoxin n=2 Tax=Paucilactobacillus hokkaidonensis TaxID=1193095 RepID=A0A0A1GZ40_9LACO|nr:flavodoxin [Paucilactobacillus hokkaidonensis]KRO10256.1 flavodoxin [Paucilactobacillus hokkaidonensis]BAP86273.1 flavodoxin [Paucilactobacillus hokkaidonensis JCM 18461]